jgi:hypothetical protein
MLSILTVIVNIANYHCEACFAGRGNLHSIACFAATLVTFQLTKKAFRSSLLWKAFRYLIGLLSQGSLSFSAIIMIIAMLIFLFIIPKP